MIRVIWNPHCRSTDAAPVGYLRLLKGIDISAVQPSSTMRPAVSNNVSHESSPRMPNCPDPLSPPPLPPPPALDTPPLCWGRTIRRLELPLRPSALTIESPCTPYPFTWN